MDSIAKVEIGQPLPPEAWLQARDDLAKALPVFGEAIRRLNFEGKGEQDKAEFMADAALAIQALTYVGTFAADKCRFVVLPGR